MRTKNVLWSFGQKRVLSERTKLSYLRVSSPASNISCLCATETQRSEFFSYFVIVVLNQSERSCRLAGTRCDLCSEAALPWWQRFLANCRQYRQGELALLNSERAFLRERERIQVVAEAESATKTHLNL